MAIIKRRAAGGRLLHYLEGIDGYHSGTALCGFQPHGIRSRLKRHYTGRSLWRYPGEVLAGGHGWPVPHGSDCPGCVAAYIKAGGQWATVQPGDD